MTGRSLNRRNFKHLQLNTEAIDPSFNKAGPSQREDIGLASAEANNRLKRYSQIPKLGPEVDVQSVESRDLQNISELGYGSGGTVSKVLHKPSGVVMAKKVIYLESTEKVRKQIVTELGTLKMCDSDFIVTYYGQFIEQNQVIVCMEFMDCGSLDKIYKATGPLSEDVLIYVNAAVVDGLVYLKQLNITHRDIKPSNILVNHEGDIKLCDFGVSGVLINSIAQSFVGTSMYMSPERIQGYQYTDAGDVWSLGLTLVELSRGEFPFATLETLPIFEFLQSVVEDPAPEPPEFVSPNFKQYASQCLQKDKQARIKVLQLNQTPFYLAARTTEQQKNPLHKWASQLLRV